MANQIVDPTSLYKPRQASGFDALSPWDAFHYFAPPIETHFVPTNASPILVSAADPMKIAILFCSDLGNTGLSTKASFIAQEGILIQLSNPFYLSYAIFGNLAQVDWYALSSVASGRLTVIETKMIDWPP